MDVIVIRRTLPRTSSEFDDDDGDGDGDRARERTMGCALSAPFAGRDGEDDLRVRGDRRRRRGDDDASISNATPTTPMRVKLCLLGASNAGKTCVSARFVRGVFLKDAKATVGAAFASHGVTLEGGARGKFEIWDTAGQERYQSLAPLYYRGATAAMVVFDVTDRESFERARYWVGELERHADANVVVALVGNKMDLTRSDGDDDDEPAVEREVSEEEGKALCEQYAMCGYVETSAKADVGVREAFELVARSVAEKNSAAEAAAAATAAVAAPTTVPGDSRSRRRR